MPATATYGTTGNAYVDGVLGGIKWAVNSLTFSFPSSGSYYGSVYGSGEQKVAFEALTATQQDATREVLKMYAAVANLTFTEVTESSSVHGDLRYAESDMPGTAWAYYPTTNAAGGDVWMNNSKNWYDNPAKGNYAWATLIHETGHALGLKHAHQASGAFGALPVDKDSLEYTVMSYRSYTGASTTGGYTNGTTSFPQTLMMYDIAAVQEMYGANYTTNSGDTVYTWSPTTGQMSINGAGQVAPAGNKIFMTLWDGGGNDTYDFSNYSTNLAVNLNPGAWTITSTTQLAALGGGKVAVGNIANALLYNDNPASLIENAIGGSGNDTLTGNAANNSLTGGRGNDTLDGQGGTDTAVYSGLSSQYSWSANSNGTWSIVDLRSGSPDGTDTLKSIEYLRFGNETVALGSSSTLSDPPSPPPQPPTLTNSLPVAVNDSYYAVRNKKLVVGKVAGVIANDTDADGDALTASLVSGSSRGKVSLAKDGSFTFTPTKNFVGTTSFKYKVTDGTGTSKTATVVITVGKTASGKAKTVVADGHDHGEIDQVPAPIGYTGPGSLATQWASVTKVVAVVQALSTSDSMLDHVLAAISGLGSMPNADDAAAHGQAVDGADSLPDFLAAYASDFGLV